MPGIIGTALSFLGSKQGHDAVGTAVKAAAEGLDHLFYSDEEKAEARQKLLEWFTDLNKDAATQNSVRSVARRELAKAFIHVFLFMVLAGCMVYPWDKEWAKYIAERLELLNWPVLSVIVFYFGPYMSTYLVQALKGNNNARNN